MALAILFVAAYALSHVFLSYGHVQLYYPPARTWALDFLNNGLTVPPCGMAPGRGPVTDLLAGSIVNMSWYLGIAHPGGYRIELLQYIANGPNYTTTSLILPTPNSTFITTNLLAESYTVTLPNITCTNCTIRLIRQNLSGGPNFVYWSCADVNIVQANKYTPSCDGRGNYNQNTQSCQCNYTFSGSYCEVSDDCVTDSDCGSNGQCLQITGYSLPQRQCFCQPGWFGIYCERVSPLSSLVFDPLQYNSTLLPLTQTMMYYRILQDSGELEVVLKGNTTSYIALGWKSLNASKTCVPLSLRYSSVDTESEPGTATTPAPPVGGTTNASAAGDLTAMYCADIVIGAAIGNLSRIGDYYTYDRSTPRHDEFYGGTQTSLTAAVGFESSSGVTTIMFRKKLIATDPTDNSVTNNPMTVIWSNGQAPADNPTNIGDFYRQDEIKYHAARRGIMTFNFYGAPPAPIRNGNPGSGSWAYPPGCSGSTTCQYQATWSLDVSSDLISFTIVANQPPTQWTAIAFAPQQKMQNMDVYVGFINNNNQAVTIDGWTSARYTPPTLDSNQNIQNSSVSYVSGVLTFSFSRPRQTNDPKDWAFNDTTCYYFIFPVGGGPVVGSNTIGQHSATPMISPNQICISSQSVTTTTLATSVTTTSLTAAVTTTSLASSHHVITFILHTPALLLAMFSIHVLHHVV